MIFDSVKLKLIRNNFVVGYRIGDFQLYINVNDGIEFGGLIYQKVCEDFDILVNFVWILGINCICFGIVVKYQLDFIVFIFVKVNNFSLIGVGYIQILRFGVKFIFFVLVDGKSINVGGYKVGFVLELEV